MCVNRPTNVRKNRPWRERTDYNHEGEDQECEEMNRPPRESESTMEENGVVEKMETKHGVNAVVGGVGVWAMDRQSYHPTPKGNNCLNHQP